LCYKQVKTFRCPGCSSRLELIIKTLDGNNNRDAKVKTKTLQCIQCTKVFPIQNDIPRFVEQNNYAKSFGYQWNKYKQTQLDSISGLSITENRFFGVTGWDKTLLDNKILEAGCGAGRFTEIVLKTQAEVYSFDYSNAVDANFKNNGSNNNLHIFQADIFSIPIKLNFFDKIFCLGVLQHTPDPEKAFHSLIPYLKPGGEICVDVYDLSFRSFFNLKYWFRPMTKRIKKEKLYKLVKILVPLLFPIKMFITEKIPFGKYFAFFIPIAYHKGFIKEMNAMSYEQLLEWSILDTFDKYAPMYDKPKTIREVKKWFNDAKLVSPQVHYGPNGIVGKAKKHI